MKSKYLTCYIIQKKQYLSQQELNQLLIMKEIKYYFYILHKNENWHITFTFNNKLHIDKLIDMFHIQKSDIIKSYKQDSIILYIKKIIANDENKKIYANFDWETRLELFDMNIRNIESDTILYRIAALKGITLNQIKNRNLQAYKKDKSLIDKFHYKYIEGLTFNHMKINFYIFGKNIDDNIKLSHNIVKVLFPNVEEHNNTLFEVTSDNLNNWVKLYEEQPTIIWNNFTANNFLKAFNNKRRTVRHILDPYCHKLKIPLSYQDSCKKSIILYNKIHIINSIYSYDSFIKKLSGIEENKYINQIDKKFSFIIKLNGNDIVLSINRNNECSTINTTINKFLLEIKNYCNLLIE